MGDRGQILADPPAIFFLGVLPTCLSPSSTQLRWGGVAGHDWEWTSTIVVYASSNDSMWGLTCYSRVGSPNFAERDLPVLGGPRQL